MIASDPSPWLEVFGRGHILLLHSPLALLPAIALLELGAALFRRPAPRGAVITLSWLTAVLTAAAAASGLVLAGENVDGGESDLLGKHKITGLVLAGLCVAAAVVAGLQRRAPFRVLLLLALGLSVPVGHLGGSLVHGPDFLTEPLQRADAPVPTTEFGRTIEPILRRTCTKCHNEDKQKGELLLTTVDGIRKGGENGAVVEPGKPDESPLVTRLELPIDHDDHMPPEGKPQPTAAEIATLRAWVAAGAKFD